MIPLKHFSDYFFEHLSIGSPASQLQITSACNAKCIFCSNEQNSFKIERTKFRPIEEIEKVLWATPPFQGDISLNESLPGRLSEGEAFLHPDFFKILGVIRKYHPNVIRITTNGSMLDVDMINNLKKFLPIKIQVSFPSVNEKYWCQTFNLGEDKYEIAKNSIRLLPTASIPVYTSLTPMPSWTGYDDIERTIAYLSGCGIGFILVYAPGYTEYTDPVVIPKLKYDKKELSDFLTRMSKTYKVVFSWSLDPGIPLDINTAYIYSKADEIYSRTKKKKSYWLTSGAAYDRLKIIFEKLFKNHPAEPELVSVPNLSYGGNIECTGLWVIEDLKPVLNKLEKTDIFIPNGFLDRYGFDLKGDSMIEYLNSYTQSSVHLI